MADVKHGGCYDCKSKEQKVLTSIRNPATTGMGKAVCDACKAKAEQGK